MTVEVFVSIYAGDVQNIPAIIPVKLITATCLNTSVAGPHLTSKYKN